MASKIVVVFYVQLNSYDHRETGPRTSVTVFEDHARTCDPCMRGSRNFHERGSTKMAIFGHRRGGGGPTPQSPEITFFM